MSIYFYYSPEAFKRDIFPTKVFGSVEKLPSEKEVPENAVKGKFDGDRKSNFLEVSTDDDTGIRGRTYSLGEKGQTTTSSDALSKKAIASNINKPRPNHASATGTGGAVVGTCNENFFKSIPVKKPPKNDSPPMTNVAPQAAQVKQRRFRVESSDR